MTEELYQQAELVDLVNDAGEAVKGEAVRLADRISVTGEFRDSIQGELLRAKNGAPFYRVWSADPGALAIEFGTAKGNKPHRILGQAIGKWTDVNMTRHPAVDRKRRQRKVEKSIDAWVAAALKSRGK
ncbi:hypothetical protein E6W39_18950 [Kitasatospora acidiphila]|uniref:Uncharacterized protein n=1 Tax=Kitasatospora acidiphila TaxID=2567942 RepID=A0A540W4J8_9ACTN|nr:hypothetical protein [Kitasatospora acidiphila]TQF03930.1 hypothetical protein E6W39_18950 [Kitasatospora acidiphila]